MGHELVNGAASQSPLGGGCVGPDRQQSIDRRRADLQLLLP